MKLFRAIFPLAVSIAALLPASGASISKQSNTTVLTDGGSWVGGTAGTSTGVPGVNDIAVWDNTVTGPNSSQLGGNTSWKGILISDVGGTRNVAAPGNYIAIANTNTASTLTIGTSGIDMSAALQALQIQSKITLAGDQTWNIADANSSANPAQIGVGEDLAFVSQGPSANAAFNLGGFTVTKTGAGTVAISHGYSLTNGTFNINAGSLVFQGAAARTTTIGSNVTLNVNNGGTLRLQCASGAGSVSTQVNGTINLATGSTLQLTTNGALATAIAGNITAAGNTTITVSGTTTGAMTFSGQLLGAGNISYANTASSALLTMTGDNSGYSGTFTLNGGTNTRVLRLGSDTAGSAAATWVVNTGNTLQVNGSSVNLGTLNGSGTVTNSHASDAATVKVGAGAFNGAITDGAAAMALTKTSTGTLALNGAGNSYTGATAVQQGTLLVGGTLSGTASVAVESGAKLGGTGTINSAAAVNINAGGALNLATDGTIGTLHTGAVSLADTSTFALEIGASTADQLAVTGAATLVGQITLSLSLLADPTDGQSFTLLDGTASLVGYSAGARFSYLGNSLDQDEIFSVTNGAFTQAFQISYTGDGGNDVTLLAVVPEPSVALALLGGVTLLSFRRRMA